MGGAHLASTLVGDEQTVRTVETDEEIATYLRGMMTSFLGGTMFDDQKRDPQTGRPIPGTTGHMFQAFDIGQFTDLEAFCAAVRSNATRIRTSPPKAGVERVYAPGDIENEKAKKHTGEGVPLEQFTLNDLAWVAETLGLEWNLV